MNDSPLDLIIYSEPHPLELESGLRSQEHWETRLVFQLYLSVKSWYREMIVHVVLSSNKNRSRTGTWVNLLGLDLIWDDSIS